MALSSTDLMPESATSLEQTPFAGLRIVRSVLLCGASVRSLAESAISAGLRPLCVDFFEDQDLTELLAGGKGRFVGRIKAFAELPAVTRSVRSSIPMLWAGGLENHTNILRQIAQRRSVIGADPDLIDRLRNPQQLQDWLTSAGLEMPRLATEATATADCQWLRKPIASSGGIGIRTVSSSSLSQSLSTQVPTSENYLQEYIDGVPMSSIFCSDKRGLQLIGSSLQLIGWPSLGASEFLFCGNVGPVEPGELIIEQLRTAATAIIERTEMVGVFGIDFILRQGRVWVLEVNPRLTASHVLYDQAASGEARVNLVERHLATYGWTTRQHHARANARSAVADGSGAAARLIIWAPTNYVVPHDMENLFENTPNTVVADRPRPGAVIPAGSPICSVHVSANDLQSIIAAIRSTTAGTVPQIPSVSWTKTAEQLAMLVHRFERNRNFPP